LEPTPLEKELGVDLKNQKQRRKTLAKKVSELEPTEESKGYQEITSTASLVGTNVRYDDGPGNRFGPNHAQTVGVCAKCSHYEYAEDDMHQIVYASCSMYNVKLGRHRIADCSNFNKKGDLSLRDMWAIATLIDGDVKNKIGFGGGK